MSQTRLLRKRRRRQELGVNAILGRCLARAVGVRQREGRRADWQPCEVTYGHCFMTSCVRIQPALLDHVWRLLTAIRGNRALESMREGKGWGVAASSSSLGPKCAHREWTPPSLQVASPALLGENHIPLFKKHSLPTQGWTFQKPETQSLALTKLAIHP